MGKRSSGDYTTTEKVSRMYRVRGVGRFSSVTDAIHRAEDRGEDFIEVQEKVVRTKWVQIDSPLLDDMRKDDDIALLKPRGPFLPRMKR